jgi:hypothetical protein
LAADNSGVTISQVVTNLTAGTTYPFAARVKIPSTSDTFTFAIRVRWRNASNATIRTDTIRSFTGSTNDSWHLAAASLAAPAGTTNAQIQMVASSLNATIYVDHFLFESK